MNPPKKPVKGSAEIYKSKAKDNRKMDSRKKPVKRSAEASAKKTKELKFIALEVKIVRALSCNNAVKRNLQVRNLPKWFELRSSSSYPFNEDDLRRIWQGLYRMMWLTDYPIQQQDLAERLGHMVNSFGGNTTCSLTYFSAFMGTMSDKFSDINERIPEKYLMLIRRMLWFTLQLLKENNWSEELINVFNKNMRLFVLCENPKSRKVTLHYLDIFIEELAKAAEGDITAAQVNIFLRPLVTFMATQRDGRMVAQCRIRVLYHLLYQSDLGRAFIEKNNKRMEEVNSDEATPMTAYVDLQAVEVDLLMPVLPLNADCVLDELQTLLRTNDFKRKRRIFLRKLIKIFETYKGGEFPLGVRKMPKVEDKSQEDKSLEDKSLEDKSLEEIVEEKVANIEKIEDEIFGTRRKLKKLSKSKRKRLLQSINFEEVEEHNYDEALEKALTAELVKSEHNNLEKTEDDEPSKRKKIRK